MFAFKKLVTVAVLTAIALPAVADISFNAGVVSDYRYRSISQTRLKPALQGGADWSHSSGSYAGAWASTIQWVQDSGGDSKVEIDLYGGFKGQLADGLAYDLGVLRYEYPRNQLAVNADTTELYAALSFGPATLKYSHSTTNLFGFADSRGSGYLDLSASFDLGGGWTVVPHIGRQTVKRNDAFTYTDVSMALSKDLGQGFSASLTVHDTNTKAYIGAQAKDLGKTGVVLGLKAVF